MATSSTSSLTQPPSEEGVVAAGVCVCGQRAAAAASMCDVAIQSERQTVDTLCDVGVQSEPVLTSFSSKTCVELLNSLSSEQIEFETKYQKLQNTNFQLRGRNPNIPMKSAALNSTYVSSMCSEIDSLVLKYDSLLLDISYSLEEAQKHTDELRSHVTFPDVSPKPPLQLPVQTPLQAGNTTPEDSVCFLDIDFSELSIDAILEQFDITEASSRKRSTAYFGAVPYSYGKLTHEAADYPQCAVFDKLFSNLAEHDKNITPENYTCLVTHYPDGSSFIPAHRDNESIIEDGSLIYTVSVGETRVLRLTNRIGPLQENDYRPDHGSVYTMTKESQDIWQHGIVRDMSISKPRISFTFRRLKRETGGPTVRGTIPHIARPSPPQVPQNSGSQKRILFLTDSLLASTPQYLFDAVPDHVCIKKVNYKLSDIFCYEPEFKYSDFVIVSAGINDLSRYKFSAESLADVVFDRLKKCCKMYPNTTFIFNSLLLTSRDWLNRDVNRFNKYLFELSLEFDNLWFFDGHSVLMASNLDCVLDKTQWNYGIHITLDAKKLLTQHLVTSLLCRLHNRGVRVDTSRIRDWRWPIRASFDKIYQSSLANR